MTNIERIISSDILASNLRVDNNLLTLTTGHSICPADIDIILDSSIMEVLKPEYIRSGVTILGITGTYAGEPDIDPTVLEVALNTSSNILSWPNMGDNVTYNIYYQRATSNTFPNSTTTLVSSDISVTNITVAPPSDTSNNYYYWYGVSYTKDDAPSVIVWDTTNSIYVPKTATTTNYTTTVKNNNSSSIKVTYGSYTVTINSGETKAITAASGTAFVITSATLNGKLGASYGTINTAKTQVTFVANANRTVIVTNETYAIKVYNNCSSTPITFHGYTINSGSYKSLTLARGTSVTIAHATKPIEITTAGGTVSFTTSNNKKTAKFTVGSAETILYVSEFYLEYNVDVTLRNVPGFVYIKPGYSLTEVDPQGATYLITYHTSGGDDLFVPDYTASGCDVKDWYVTNTETDSEGYTTTTYELKIYNFTSYSPTVVFAID